MFPFIVICFFLNSQGKRYFHLRTDSSFEFSSLDIYYYYLYRVTIRLLIRSPFQTFVKEGMMSCHVAKERPSHLYISFSLIFCIFPKLPWWYLLKLLEIFRRSKERSCTLYWHYFERFTISRGFPRFEKMRWFVELFESVRAATLAFSKRDPCLWRLFNSITLVELAPMFPWYVFPCIWSLFSIQRNKYYKISLDLRVIFMPFPTKLVFSFSFFFFFIEFVVSREWKLGSVCFLGMFPLERDSFRSGDYEK